MGRLHAVGIHRHDLGIMRDGHPFLRRVAPPALHRPCYRGDAADRFRDLRYAGGLVPGQGVFLHVLLRLGPVDLPQVALRSAHGPGVEDPPSPGAV